MHTGLLDVLEPPLDCLAALPAHPAHRSRNLEEDWLLYSYVIHHISLQPILYEIDYVYRATLEPLLTAVLCCLMLYLSRHIPPI
jgi:hypothetical protein